MDSDAFPVLRLVIEDNCLDIEDVGSLSSLCMNIHSVTDNDSLWKFCAYAYMPLQFWIAASQRDMRLADPLPTMKQELERIVRFQKSLKSINTVWTLDHYKLWWKNLDKCRDER